MFVGYANDHSSNTFKLLNLKTHQIWKSRDVKWIASSIVTLQEPKPQTPPAEDDNEDDIHTWAQDHGVNVIPDDDDDANLAAPIGEVDEDQDIDTDDKDVDEEEEPAEAHPIPATNNKTL